MCTSQPLSSFQELGNHPSSHDVFLANTRKPANHPPSHDVDCIVSRASQPFIQSRCVPYEYSHRLESQPTTRSVTMYSCDHSYLRQSRPTTHQVTMCSLQSFESWALANCPPSKDASIAITRKSANRHPVTMCSLRVPSSSRKPVNHLSGHNALSR